MYVSAQCVPLLTPATAMVSVGHTSVTHVFQGDITPSIEQMGKTKVNLHVTLSSQLFNFFAELIELSVSLLLACLSWCVCVHNWPVQACCGEYVFHYVMKSLLSESDTSEVALSLVRSLSLSLSLLLCLKFSPLRCNR